MVQPALQRAVDIVGSQKALADAIDTKQQNISYWLKASVPAEFALPIEKATNGAVTRHDLRPDLWPSESAA